MARIRGKTQSQSHFAKTVHSNISKSTFMRNSTKKTTFNAGELVPIYIDEIVPGDVFEFDLKAIIRFIIPPVFPTMDLLEYRIHAFFVPNRLVYDRWEELMGENKSGPWTPTNPPPPIPRFESNVPVAGSGSIGDYYGIPVGVPIGAMGVSQLPLRGYGLIWNEWFRDQNLQAPIPINLGAGWSSSRLRPHYPLLRVNKPHDYFTSALPSPQKGESSLIPINIDQLIPVMAMPGVADGTPGSSLTWTNVVSGNSFNATTRLGINGLAPSHTVAEEAGPAGLHPGQVLIKPRNLFANATGLNLNATTIHELRTAFQIQRLYERDARAGTRYVEMLKAHFGVEAEDYRLQRPEYLGFAKGYVGMQQVVQNSASGMGDTPQGNLTAYSYTQCDHTLFKKSFVEHGFLHIFVEVRHRKTYQQGLERFWSHQDRLDHFLPVLAHISEQPIYNKELFADGNTAVNDQIHGFQEPWAFLKYKPNGVTGQCRNGVPNSLYFTHYADWYDSRPNLSAQWITDNSRENIQRTLAVTERLGQHQFIMDIAFLNKATRPIPLHSIPGMVDHH